MILWDRPFDLFLLHLPPPPHHPAARLERSTHHTCRVRVVWFQGGDSRALHNVARRIVAFRCAGMALSGVCCVFLCMHRMCRGMEKGAANTALGSAREPVGGFDCACSVVLFRSRRVGVRAGVTDQRKKVGAHFNRRPLCWFCSTL